MLLLAAILLGCGTTQSFKVDAIKGPHTQRAALSFRISDQSRDRVEGSLLQKEFTQYINAALSSHGMYMAEPNEEPDVEIEAAFDIIGPITITRTRTEPTYISMPALGVPRSATISEAPVHVPSQSQSSIQNGERTVLYDLQIYRKVLRLVARDSRTTPGNPARELWRVRVTNDDKSNDKRRYASLMSAAAMDLIGKDSGSAREVSLNKRDDRVRFLKQSLEL